MSATSIRLEMDSGLAIVSLAQAARGNPIDDVFVRDYRRIVSELKGMKHLRAVLMRADGPNFCYGGDLKAFQREALPLGELVRRWTADLHAALLEGWQLAAPVIAAVQGYAMGGGASLVAGSDVVVAGESAKIGSAFTQLGFSCDSGSSITLTARMGPAQARRFVLLAEVLGAKEAQQVGLFDMVVPDAAVAEEALALAKRLADGPTIAYGEVKRLFGRTWAAMAREQLEDESATLARVVGSADAMEGLAAMLEKRKPHFRGR
jgi:2-(1,2-epoxy-1,2-dihydrophenyl)acetyl-CoA isomerase